MKFFLCNFILKIKSVKYIKFQCQKSGTAYSIFFNTCDAQFSFKIQQHGVKVKNGYVTKQNVLSFEKKKYLKLVQIFKFEFHLTSFGYQIFCKIIFKLFREEILCLNITAISLRKYWYSNPLWCTDLYISYKGIHGNSLRYKK